LNWLTRCLVVADGEERSHVATSVGQALRRAVNSSAANLSGALPNHLAEVAPLVEVVHVDLNLGILGFLSCALGEVDIQVVVVANLAVVEQFGDHGRNVVGLDTGSDVLAVASAVDLPDKSQ
jgi:hypothetical protein